MSNRVPLVLDCDTGEDDAIAIVLAVMGKIPLKYIITSHGNTSLENATQNSSRILSLLNNDNIKVIKGASKPMKKHLLEGDNFTVGEDFLGKNGLCNIELPESQYDNILDFGEDKYIEEFAKLIQKEGKVDYIITGPATNFAKLCNYFGNNIKKYINNLYIMGGAIYVQGTRGAGVKNTSHDRGNEAPKTWAEFNFYCDPLAIDTVFKADLNPCVVTWDQCIDFELPLEYINTMSSHSEGGQFVIDLMKSFMDLYGTENKTDFELCDPLTIMAYLRYGKRKKDQVLITTDKIEYGKSSSVKEGGSFFEYFYVEDSESRDDIIDSMFNILKITTSKKRHNS